MRTASGGPLSPCVANPDECYGGVAAEIGVKNMPPACFLNTPTRKVGKRASRNQGSCTSLRAMHCTNRNCLPHVHRKFPVSFRHRIVSAPAPLPLMLSTVDHSALYGGGVRAPRPTQRLPVEFRRARCPHRAAYRAVVLVVGCRGRRLRRHIRCSAGRRGRRPLRINHRKMSPHTTTSAVFARRRFSRSAGFTCT